MLILPFVFFPFTVRYTVIVQRIVSDRSILPMKSGTLMKILLYEVLKVEALLVRFVFNCQFTEKETANVSRALRAQTITLLLLCWSIC